MISGIIGREIRRSNRNLLVVNGLLLVVLVVVLVACRSMLSNAWQGPREITGKEVAQLTSADGLERNWVRFRLDRDSLSEKSYVITHEKGAVTQYFFQRVGNKCFIITTQDRGDPPDVIDGDLENLSVEAQDKAIPATAGFIQTSVLPVMIAQDNMRLDAGAMLAIWTPVMVLVVWNLTKGIRRLGNPGLHPLAKKLERWGPPEEIAVAIDAEHQTGLAQKGSVRLTQSWLIRPTRFGCDLVFLGDIVWTHRKETKHKSYGVTTSTTFSTVIYDKYGKQLAVPLKQQMVNELMASIQQRVPWVLVGYDQKLSALWRKNRNEFLRIVETREQEYRAAVNEPKPPEGNVG